MFFGKKLTFTCLWAPSSHSVSLPKKAGWDNRRRRGRLFYGKEGPRISKLTDKQRKQIIAERIEGLSIRKLATKYGVSPSAIQKIVRTETDLVEKCAEKKEQNTQDMLDYLDARTLKAQHVLDLAFESLLDPTKYDKAGVQSIATMMGIIIDKYAQLTELNRNGGMKNELLQSLLDLEKRSQVNVD